MSKRITYKGQLQDGLQDKIKLSTIKGKVGYRIIDFKIMGRRPGQDSYELVCQVFTKDKTGAISSVVDFTNSELVAVAFNAGAANAINYPQIEQIIFGSEIFNQDLFVTANDVSGNTVATNYYLELETISLTDIQSTQLTLKNLRTITS